MIFSKETVHFNFRVAGVAIHNGRVLLDRNSRNQYWVLPGGHPDMMESMTDALKREIKEEIDEDVKVSRLLWVVENFFHRKKDIHELSFYFEIHLAPNSRLLQSDGPFYGQEHDQQLLFQWHPIDEVQLAGLPLMPGFLASALVSVPETPQHIVVHDLKKTAGAKVDNFLSIP